MNSPGFRILSLDGGGVRGAFTAAFLAQVERKLGKPVGEYFDLIAGTSTGGIIATALALGEPAAAVEAMYEKHAEAIFSRPSERALPLWARLLGPFIRKRMRGVDEAWLLGTKYEPHHLRRALTEVLGDRTLEQAKRRLLVPAVDLARGQTVVFKTPHLPGLDRDRHFRAVDVVMATTAAPTYFPHAVIGSGSAYCDGGLWANNPSVVAIAEACRISEACARPGVDSPFSPSEIKLLSIGTGESSYFVQPPGDSAGMLFWGTRVIDVMGTSQSQGIGFLCQYLLSDDRYRRVDFQMPDGGWRLDAVEMLAALIHRGREEAERQFESLKPAFFGAGATSLTAFPRP